MIPRRRCGMDMTSRAARLLHLSVDVDRQLHRRRVKCVERERERVRLELRPPVR